MPERPEDWCPNTPAHCKQARLTHRKGESLEGTFTNAVLSRVKPFQTLASRDLEGSYSVEDRTLQHSPNPHRALSQFKRNLERMKGGGHVPNREPGRREGRRGTPEKLSACSDAPRGSRQKCQRLVLDQGSGSRERGWETLLALAAPSFECLFLVGLNWGKSSLFTSIRRSEAHVRPFTQLRSS